MEGITRLQNEVLELNDINISAIFEFLKTRNDLQEKFNNEEKTITQMYKFIYEKARKQAIKNVAMISDKVVYLWAITYFSKANEELGLNKKAEVTTKNAEKKETIKEDTKDTTPKKEEQNQITMFEEVKQ